MQSLKKYAKRALNSPTGISLRNWTGIRPVHFKFREMHGAYSASDFFLWRTDGGMKTSIRISDIAALFFDTDATLELKFYSHDGVEIKSDEFDLNGLASDLTIDAEYMGREGWGYFTAFSVPKSELTTKVTITNRCYVGFSKGEPFFSYVHGNMHCRAKLLDGARANEEISVVYPAKQNTKYVLQKPFDPDARHELYFVNPIERDVKISVNGETHSLAPMHAALIEARVGDDQVVTIESDFTYPRPVIFSHRGDFFDVHHG